MPRSRTNIEWEGEGGGGGGGATLRHLDRWTNYNWGCILCTLRNGVFLRLLTRVVVSSRSLVNCDEARGFISREGYSHVFPI